MRTAVWCFVVLSSLPLSAQQKPAPSPAKPSAPELTAEGYRDLILNVADAVSPLQGTVIVGMHALQREVVCVVTLDKEKAKLAAQSAGDHRKAWAGAWVNKALEASHAQYPASRIEQSQERRRSVFIVDNHQLGADKYGTGGVTVSPEDDHLRSRQKRSVRIARLLSL